jgi:hypothetical protein
VSAQEAPRPLEVLSSGPAPDSPLGRLRAAHHRRQETSTVDVPLPGAPGLIARIGVISDPDVAMGAIRMAGGLGGAGDITGEEAMDTAVAIIAAGVLGLYARTPDGLEPVTDEHGRIVRFDAHYGQAIGVPDIQTGTAGVYAHFTVGEPPTVDAAGLLLFAAEVARFTDQESQPDPGPSALTS